MNFIFLLHIFISTSSDYSEYIQIPMFTENFNRTIIDSNQHIKVYRQQFKIIGILIFDNQERN